MSGASFSFAPVRRRGFKVFVALVGASGTGKTLSALRLARGIAAVAGGKVMALDTEGGRMVAALQDREMVDGKSWFHYHEFQPPYTPERYAAAIHAAHQQGASVVVIDSMSHEHDGEGGTLDRHAAYSGGQKSKNFIAWARIREEQRALHRLLEKPPVHIVAAFKAKEKLAIQKGEDPAPLGWMPIGDPGYVYAMTARVILRPDAPGIPSDPRELTALRGRVSEADIQKCPSGLGGLWDGDELDERDGELIARWASLGNTGDDAPPPGPSDAERWSAAVRRHALAHKLTPRDAAEALIRAAGLPGPPSRWPAEQVDTLWDAVDATARTA